MMKTSLHHEQKQNEAFLIQLPQQRESSSDVASASSREAEQPNAALPTKPYENNRKKAVLAVNLYIICQQMYNVAAKISVEYQISTLDLMLYIAVVPLVLTTATASSQGISLWPEPETRKPLVLRSVISTITFFLRTYGITLIPLVTNQLINMTAPFWSAVFAWLFISERATKKEVLAMLMSFFVISMVSVVNAMGSSDVSGEGSQYVADSSKMYLLGVVCCLAGPVGNGFIAVFTRQMQAESFLVPTFYAEVFQLAIMMVLILVKNALTSESFSTFSYDREQMLILGVAGAINTGLGFAKVIAFQSERPAFVSLLTYVAIVYSFFFDWYFFALKPSWADTVGIVIILTLNLMIVVPQLQAPDENSEKPDEHYKKLVT